MDEIYKRQCLRKETVPREKGSVSFLTKKSENKQKFNRSNKIVTKYGKYILVLKKLFEYCIIFIMYSKIGKK